MSKSRVRIFAWAAAEAIKEKPDLFLEIVNGRLKKNGCQLELKKEVKNESQRK